MRAAPEGFTEAIATSHTVGAQCAAWRGGRHVADVPMIDGTLTATSSSAVPDSVTIAVPARDPVTGFDWVPGNDPDHPLAKNGQQLAIRRGIVRADGGMYVDLGRYRIDDWDVSDDVVTVTASGLLSLADWIVATAWSASGGTLSHAVRILAQRLPVRLADGLTDRAAPPGLAWAPDVNRLTAINEVLRAWPASAKVDAQGVLVLSPPPDPNADPVITLTDGENGTVIAAPESDTRAGIFNAYVVTGQGTDTARTPRSALYIYNDPGSVYRWDGDYGANVGQFHSPIMTTDAQCLTAARTLTHKSLTRINQTTITHIPDPRVELGDRVELRHGDTSRVGTVIELQLPLTAAGGAQQTTIGGLE